MKAELFGPYRLDELIGRGGMGEVYRAFDSRRNRAVALKRLPFVLGANAEIVARFRREADIAAGLRAPHIVPIHDYGEIDGQLFIDMRLVNGTDLARLLAAGGALDPARALAIIAQVASALDDAHTQGVVHRDVKPSNVLLTADDFAYLADFGVARALSGGTTLTVTGATVGTMAYMAPERFRGQPGDHLADIYALACVLYEMLTGRPPFAGQGLPALMYAHVHQTPPLASAQRRGIPSALDGVVARGMAKDPGQRFTSASQLVSAARATLGDPVSAPLTNDRPVEVDTLVGAPLTPEAASEPPPSPARPRDRGSVLAVPVVLLILVAAITLIVLVVKPFETSSAQPEPVNVAPSTVGLERFYGQSLSWSGCASFAATSQDKRSYADPGLRCAYLDVPLDYANPNGRVIKIGLLRRPASDKANRIGSLVINPGGPGGSGMSVAASLADQVANNDIGRRFDFVGFDPRGVGASEPQVVCRTPAERDAERLMNLNVDTSPAGVAKTEAREKADNEGCISRTGKDVLANIGTRDVVRDLDVMRSALGDEKLTYLGYSYGTKIGTTYAEVFPRNVRAMVLDGAVDPAQDPISRLIEQGRGFQKAFDEFVAWCVARSDCGVGTEKDRAVSRYQEMVRPLIAASLPVSDGRRLSYTDATIGTVQALYLSDLWPMLNRGLRELAQGQGETFMRLSDVYYGRESNGSYSTGMDVFQSVLCADNQTVKDPDVARGIDARYRAVAPFLDSGQPPSPALDNCAFWPVPPTSSPHHPQTPGLPTVMVISTTQDPTTPYQAGVNLADALKARLLTYEGTQHTAFLQGISCVDSAGVRYLASLELPAEGTRCQRAR